MLRSRSFSSESAINCAARGELPVRAARWLSAIAPTRLMPRIAMRDAGDREARV